jgi:GTP-binding protein EngB required for normal cell division
VPLDSIRTFVAESDNPENVKQVDYLSIDLRELHRFEGLRFVDTPGLESALAHNSQASRDWLPKAGLALVAMSVDPPLSEHDINLIETLYDYTPNVSLLVTKADILTEQERAEVLDFVRTQLTRRIGKPLDILPYSIRPGYDLLRADVERKLANTIASFNEQRTAILERKTDTLLRECEDYLRLALRAAETKDTERDQLDRLAAAEREAIGDVNSEFHLIVQHAAGGVRSGIAAMLDEFQPAVEKHLSIALDSEFPKWTTSLAIALDEYQEWLRREMSEQLGGISTSLRPEFIKPLQKTSKQILRSLQAIRDRLSECTERAFGIPLRTTEPDIAVEEPKAPDIRIGRIFDRNWDLLSPVLPMWLIRKIVHGHFRRTLSFLVYANLSRLASQWGESIVAALATMENEAGKRIDDLMKTVENLLSTDTSDAVRVREDLVRIGQLRDRIKEALPQNHED